MLFSESWLRTYVNPAISSEELQDALTMHGLEVWTKPVRRPPISRVS